MTALDDRHHPQAAARRDPASTHLEHPRTDQVTHPTRWLLHAGRPAARWLIRRRYRVEVVHPERMPGTGPVILAANHVGIVDGPLLAIFAPRPVHALTKIEMFTGALGRFLPVSGQIPLDRFRVDPAAVRTSVRVLRDGGVVGIFPEGARGAGDLALFHRGAAYLALVTGAPVVPVTMIGTREAGSDTGSLPAPGTSIQVVLGTPFQVARTTWPRQRQLVGETSRLLRAKMLVDLQAALDESGRLLPGPLPAGQHEPDPGGGVTERSA